MRLARVKASESSLQCAVFEPRVRREIPCSAADVSGGAAA